MAKAFLWRRKQRRHGLKPYISIIATAFLIGAWLPYLFDLWGGTEFPTIATLVTMYVLSWEKLHE
jgi:hypothetical protein